MAEKNYGRFHKINQYNKRKVIATPVKAKKPSTGASSSYIAQQLFADNTEDEASFSEDYTSGSGYSTDSTQDSVPEAMEANDERETFAAGAETSGTGGQGGGGQGGTVVHMGAININKPNNTITAVKRQFWIFRKSTSGGAIRNWTSFADQTYTDVGELPVIGVNTQEAEDLMEWNRGPVTSDATRRHFTFGRAGTSDNTNNANLNDWTFFNSAGSVDETFTTLRNSRYDSYRLTGFKIKCFPPDAVNENIAGGVVTNPSLIMRTAYDKDGQSDLTNHMTWGHRNQSLWRLGEEEGMRFNDSYKEYKIGNEPFTIPVKWMRRDAHVTSSITAGDRTNDTNMDQETTDWYDTRTADNIQSKGIHTQLMAYPSQLNKTLQLTGGEGGTEYASDSVIAQNTLIYIPIEITGQVEFKYAR